MRRIPRRAVTATVVLGLVVLGLCAAEAAERRAVAVLEYRAGAQGVASVADRLAARLQQAAALNVISPQEARRRASPRVDADVARCGGDPRCIGALGRTFGADEVLLVGVSQLGDIVLALQRIDTAKGVALSRVAVSMPPDAEVSDEQLLGWLERLFPPEAFKRFGAIKILTNVDSAYVTVDGAGRGKTPLAEALSVTAPGSHSVVVDKSGYVSFRARIEVPPDATVEVRAELVTRTPPQAWYKRWYVWAAIGGAVVVAGAAVGIDDGTRVDETPMGYIRLPR